MDWVNWGIFLSAAQAKVDQLNCQISICVIQIYFCARNLMICEGDWDVYGVDDDDDDDNNNPVESI